MKLSTTIRDLPKQRTSSIRRNLPALAAGCLLAVVSSAANPPAADKIIKVGLIRADSHGIYYAALMDEHDPLLLQKPPTTLKKPPYSWMRGSYHKLFYSETHPTERTAPFVGGFDIVKVWDEHPEAARAFAAVLKGGPQVCTAFEEVSDGVDLVLVADCNYDGSDHLKLATPGLKKGVPTFVDKPFAFDLKEARAIVALAQSHNTAVYSRSILSELPQIEGFRQRFAEIGGAEFGVVRGGGAGFDGQVHGLAAALAAFGGGVVRVDSMGEKPLSNLLLSWGAQTNRPADGVALHCVSGGMGATSGFYAAAFSSRGAVFSEGWDSRAYPAGAVRIVEQMKAMVRTRKPPIPYEDMLEPIAIAAAARLAHAEQRPVTLAEVVEAAAAP